MMAQPGPCPKCGGSMTEGYVMGRSYSSSIPALASWVQGKAERSIWTGLKLKGRPRMQLTANRCGRCGFVETYATGDAAAAEKADERTLLVVASVIALIGAMLVAVLLGMRMD